jgi:hypothetical protein
MADLRLNILGDSAQAVAAMSKAQVGVALLGKALVDFASSSVDAFQESEQADRRLALVAGESTAALKAQAEAIQASTGISGEHVQGLQAMLASYGQAPAEIDATVKAVLDLSAATGQDANSALQELLASTEGGRKAFKGLGIEFSDVGTKADVLRNATQALSAKFGGAAEAEGNTLAGSTRKAKETLGDLKETFGGMIVEFAQKTGVIDNVTAALQILSEQIFGNAKERKQNEILEAVEEVERLKGRIERLRAGGASQETLGDLEARLEAAKAEVRKLKNETDATLSTVGRAQQLQTNKGNAAAKQAAEEAKRLKEEEEKEAAERVGKRIENLEAIERYEAQQAKEAKAAQKKKLEEEKRANKELNDERKKALAEQKKVLDEEARQWEAAGIAIGGALANALSQSLEALASGGEADAGAIMADVLAAIVSTAVSFIPGFGGFAGVAGQLTRTVTRAATNQGKRRHDGGWAMDSFPRYHLGNWVGSDEEMAILQNGERVLSRSEVAAMGGPKGVERAARGTSGSVVNIQTFDAGSFREMFSGRARQGIIDANRTGRGISSFFGGR